LKVSPVSGDEARELQSCVYMGRKAFDRFVMANTRLVMKLAHRYKGRGVPYDDLCSEGVFGMMTAVNKFNPDLGYRFSTYAQWWIVQAMQRSLGDAPLVRLPERKAALASKIARAREEQRSLLGEEPDVTDIAAAVGCTVDEVNDIVRYTLIPVSLDMPAGDEGDSTVGDFLADSTALDPSEVAAASLMKRDVVRALSGLPLGESEVLASRFGLGRWAGEPGTLAVTAERLGRTVKQVRRLEDAALARLRGEVALAEYLA
jgi:RNA polymerase primary sigma factor